MEIKVLKIHSLTVYDMFCSRVKVYLCAYRFVRTLINSGRVTFVPRNDKHDRISLIYAPFVL